MTQIATWNVNSLSVRLPQVLDWLAAHPAVDVLALQETKLTDDKFPHQAFADAGFHSVCFGQKTYNGVALVTRAPAADVLRNIPDMDCDMARVLTATCALNAGLVRVVCVYVPNGQSPDSDKFAYKMRWLTALRAWLVRELAQHPRLVLLGDFNITFDDRDVYDPIAWHEAIHCTTQEREHVRQLVALGLDDSLRLFAQPENTYSWWDYRQFAFRRNRGLRIDHILTSHALRASITACHVDKAPRAHERPSDHAPVVLTLA